MKKKVLKFTALIGLIFFALNTDVLAENSDDSACPDDGGGPDIKKITAYQTENHERHDLLPSDFHISLILLF